MSDERRTRVLRAIVEDYVATNEPVGSKALVDKHELGVSSATIRNDMAALEAQGLIAQPHTSAGRIPTDMGYRVFVDRLDEIKPLTAAERRAIARVLSGPLDVDEMLERTVRLLSGLTHQVALVQYPTATKAALRHIELVDLAPGRVLAVLITDSGQVEQRLVDLGQTVGEDDLAGLRDAFNRELRGVRVTAVAAALAAVTAAPELAAARAAIAQAIAELAALVRQERLVMAGAANLARAGRELGEHIGPLLEAFEEQVVMLRLLASMADEPDRVSVSIGSENALESFATTSVVASSYGVDGTEARLAVLGPTRMDYPTTMSAVRAVARYISVILAE